MATAVKRKLSGSTDGKPIKVAATAPTGTTIHTAVASTVAGTWDEVWLLAYNNSSVAVVLTIVIGDSDLPIVMTLPSKVGLIPIRPGIPLQNSQVITAYADTANVIGIEGFVNAITD